MCLGRLRKYEVLVTLEFTSARKRSSVVVMERLPDGSEVVLGAGCGWIACMISCRRERKMPCMGMVVLLSKIYEVILPPLQLILAATAGGSHCVLQRCRLHY